MFHDLFVVFSCGREIETQKLSGKSRASQVGPFGDEEAWTDAYSYAEADGSVHDLSSPLSHPHTQSIHELSESDEALAGSFVTVCNGRCNGRKLRGSKVAFFRIEIELGKCDNRPQIVEKNSRNAPSPKL